MNRPTIRIINQQTNEILDREMTSDEFAMYQEKLAQESIRQEGLNQKAAAKAALLAKLGITEEEAKLLLS